MTACHAPAELSTLSPSSSPPMRERPGSQITCGKELRDLILSFALSRLIFLLTFFAFFWETVSCQTESRIIDERLLRKKGGQGDVLKRAVHKCKLGHGRAVQGPFCWLIDGSVSLHLCACCFERRWVHMPPWKRKRLSPSTYPSRGQGPTRMSVVFWFSCSEHSTRKGLRCFFREKI